MVSNLEQLYLKLNTNFYRWQPCPNTTHTPWLISNSEYEDFYAGELNGTVSNLFSNLLSYSL